MRPDLERDYVEFVSARLPRLHRTAYLLCGDSYQADDIVQAAVTSLYVHWKRASAADNIDAYLHRILVRRYLDERRRKWSRIMLGDRVPDLPAAEGHSVEERDALMTALRALPKGQRAVIVLRYFGDLSVEETAQILGCSTGNVKSQCARGIAALRGVLGATAMSDERRARS
jgi:RNA polymerase sigma-70 factor (sigma-E family)